jgi:hypothetical protein
MLTALEYRLRIPTACVFIVHSYWCRKKIVQKAFCILDGTLHSSNMLRHYHKGRTLGVQLFSNTLRSVKRMLDQLQKQCLRSMILRLDHGFMKLWRRFALGVDIEVWQRCSSVRNRNDEMRLCFIKSSQLLSNALWIVLEHSRVGILTLQQAVSRGNTIPRSQLRYTTRSP